MASKVKGGASPKSGTLSLQEMKELNNQFRGKPDVTNVLSFPQDVKGALFFDDPSYMGDIALGFEVINEESYQQKKG